MENEAEAKMDQDNTKEAPAIEGHIPRARSNTLNMPLELTRMRSRYEEATEDYERAQSRAESRRTRGPPKGFSRITAVAADIWTHHISIIVPQNLVRDHLALERTFLSYLKTSQAFALLSVVISQLFKLQRRANPDPVLGYNAVGRPLAVICMCMAIVYMLIGFFRWWRLQQGLVHGKAIAGGFELALIMIGSALLIATLLALSIAIAIRREKS